MSLKNFLSILFTIAASIAYPADTKQTTAPSEQISPAAPQKEDSPSSSNAAPASEKASSAQPSEQVPAPLPSSVEMTTSYESAFVRMLVTLLGLVFLVFATFWILRRLGKGKFKMGSGRSINVIEKRALSPKSMLYIVEIGNRKVLISESQIEVRALTSFEETPEVEE